MIFFFVIYLRGYPVVHSNVDKNLWSIKRAYLQRNKEEKYQIYIFVAG